MDLEGLVLDYVADEVVVKPKKEIPVEKKPVARKKPAPKKPVLEKAGADSVVSGQVYSAFTQGVRAEGTTQEVDKRPPSGGLFLAGAALFRLSLELWLIPNFLPHSRMLKT